MPLFRKLTALAGAAEAARRYAKSHPDQAARYLDKAAQFVDKQTKGKYTNQIAGATRRAKGVAGIPQPGHGYGAPGTTQQVPPPVPGQYPHAAGGNGSGSYGETGSYPPPSHPGQAGQPPRY